MTSITTMNMTEVKSEMETKIENFINTFKSEQSDFESVKENMMQLFFEMHIHCSKIALKTDTKKKSSTKKTNLGNFASKKAKELAEENGLSEADLTGTGKNGKITKKDIVAHLPKEVKAPKKKEEVRKKTPCNGITKYGNPCSRSGSHQPDGASKFYCYKCVKNWELREVSSLPEENIFSGSESEDSDFEYFENLKTQEKKKPTKMLPHAP
jgi:pyruvate/2-oxoglutarate dehydrogenase complex dihydrolipoamide acyltransferase (E2) component